MFILLSFLVTGVDFKPTCLDSLTGKWTIGLKMNSLLDFNEYAILWRPAKTIMIGIRGRLSLYEEEEWHQSGFLCGEFYKYFNSSHNLVPYFAITYTTYDIYNMDHYSIGFNLGMEYFFTLQVPALKENKLQLSAKLETEVCRISHHTDNFSYSFILPTGGNITTYLCFHF